MTDNELIYKFMGRHTNRNAMSDEELSMSDEALILSMSYRSKWDCLMPVVRLIEKRCSEDEIPDFYRQIFNGKIDTITT